MTNELRSLGRAGFTLIEVLVTLILVSLLAAAVFPVITQQIGAADAPKLASDLSSLRSGIELFNANVRIFPGDLDDLVNKPSPSENSIEIGTTNLYQNKHLVRWDGPYVDLSLDNDVDPFADDAADNVVNNLGTVNSKLRCVDAAVVTPASIAAANCATSAGHFVAIELTGFSTDEFAKLNDAVDPSEETFALDSERQGKGKLRCVVSNTNCSSVFYLVSPYIAK